MASHGEAVSQKRPINGCLLTLILGVITLIAALVGEWYLWHAWWVLIVSVIVFAVMVQTMALAKMAAISVPQPE